MTVFTRSESSKKDLPIGVRVAEVDYASLDSLVNALKGKSTVVSTLNGDAILGQKLIIDAAIQAGVQRFIPADFGSLTTHPEAQKLPVHYPLVQIQKYLTEKAEKGEIEYTIFSTGPFLDLILSFPFAFDYANKKAELISNGQHPFSTTTTVTIGKAVARALKDPQATKNRNIFIHDIVTTQAKLVALAKTHSPPGVQWTETNVDARVELKKLLDDVAKVRINHYTAVGLLRAAIFSGQYPSEYKTVDNEHFQLGFWVEDDLDKLVASKVQ